MINSNFCILYLAITLTTIPFRVFSQNNKNLIIDYPQALLVITDDCKLTAINITDSRINDIFYNMVICHVDFYKDYNLYFSSSLNIIRSFEDVKFPDIHLPTTNIEKELQNNKFFYKFSVDFFNEKIYATAFYNNDHVSSDLMVIDIKTQTYNILLSGLDAPKGIELDPFSGLLFILQSSSIFRANMDGTNGQNIIVHPEITSLSIDYYAKKMYWIKSSLNIWSSDYSGLNARPMKFWTSSTELTNVVVLNNLLFYVSTDSKNTSVVWTCNVSSTGNIQKCSEPKLFALFDIKIKALKIYDIENMNSNSMTMKNPCEDSKCEQLCLLTNDMQGFSCYCKIGYHIKNDLVHCEKNRENSQSHLLTSHNTINTQNRPSNSISDNPENTQYNPSHLILDNPENTQNSLSNSILDNPENTQYNPPENSGNTHKTKNQEIPTYLSLRDRIHLRHCLHLRNHGHKHTHYDCEWLLKNFPNGY